MTTTTNNTHTIIDALNDYNGDNLWQDVIYSQLDLDIDEDTLDELDPSGASTILPLADGRVFRYSEQYGKWDIDA